VDSELWRFGAGRTFCRVLTTCGATMRIRLSANTGTQTLGAGPVSGCRGLVERAEVLALAEADEPLQISALCAALSVSERTPQGISQDPWSSALPASSNAAIVTGKTRTDGH
jgi:hypothetical protein